MPCRVCVATESSPAAPALLCICPWPCSPPIPLCRAEVKTPNGNTNSAWEASLEFFQSPSERYSLGTSAYFASCPCCSLWLFCFPQSEPRHVCQETERSRRLHQICRVSRINAHCYGQNRIHVFPPAPAAGRAMLCHSLG